MSGGRIAALIVGLLIALVGALFTFAGFAIQNADQFVETVETDGVAVVIDSSALTGDQELTEEERQEFGDFEFSFIITSERGLFIGRALEEDVSRFLEDAPHVLVDLSNQSVLDEIPGTRNPDPDSESFWIESTSGPSTGEVTVPFFQTQPEQVVVMNSDESAGVSVDVAFDFSSFPFVGTFAAIALGGGIVAVLFGLGLAAWAIISRKKGDDPVVDPLGYDT